MTLQLGTDGSSNGPAKVEYTCPGAASGPTCGPEVVNGRWAKTLTAPVGMAIWIHAVSAKEDGSGAAPNCWISDESGQNVLAKNDGGSCTIQVKEHAP